MKTRHARAAILCAAGLWGCIGLFYDQLSAIGLTSIEIVFLRTSVAAVLMGLYVFIRDRTLFHIRFRDLWMFIGTGIISLAFFNFCYFNAIDRIGLSAAAMLLYTAPVFVMVLSAILFRERMTFVKWLSVGVTCVGCFLVTGMFGDAALSTVGILFGLGSGIGYALYTIFSVYALRRYRTETITFYTFLFAAVGVLPFCRFSSMVTIASVDPLPFFLCTIGIAVFACVLPYMFYTAGLCRVQAGEASIMATLEPVVATLIGVFVLDDTFSLLKGIGMACIVGAIILVNIPKRTKSKER